MAAERGERGRTGGGGEPPPRSPAAARKGFLLRLPPRLLADLRAWAQQDLRSLNAQIEYLLADALRRRRGGADDEAG